MSSQRSAESAFIEAVKLRNLLPKGSSVLAAVSGGSDSIALLRLLHRFSHHMSWKLAVLHIDHHARPGSGDDAAFVKGLADELGLHCSIEEISSQESGSSEGYFSAERSRIYNDYSSGNNLIATGHTASDRAETILIRLLEGAGLRGLGGMDYFGRGAVRRPLLDFTRNDISTYLEIIGQTWIEDQTNEEEVFLRNRIRHRIIPVLESISPGCTRAIARSSGNLANWRDAADSLIDDALIRLLDDQSFRREQYIDLPRVIRLGILWSVCGKPRGGKLELEKTDRWIIMNKNGFHILPGGSRITSEDGRYFIRKSMREDGMEEK